MKTMTLLWILLMLVMQTQGQNDSESMNLTRINMTKNSCDPCPAGQTCVYIQENDTVCKCPHGYIGTNCSSECLHNYADIAFLLDSSDSISDEDWLLMIQFVSSVITQLLVEEKYIRIAIITFGDEAHVEMRLEGCNTTENIIDGLRNLTHRKEKTNIADALVLMRTEIFRKPYQGIPIGILITDGSSTVNETNIPIESQQAKDAGITMFVVGIGKYTRLPELEAMASRPLSKHLLVMDNIMAQSHLINGILEITSTIGLRYQTGVTGFMELVGQVGVSGPIGLPAVTGQVIRPGVKGMKGDPGDPGLPGPLGNNGVLGPKGDIGAVGRPGSTGDNGTTGYQGDAGEPGRPGPSVPGLPGVPGPMGMPGQNGSTGYTGGTGGTGSPGLIGAPGQSGVPGSDGHSGDKGPPGYPGNTGLPGPPGLPGTPGVEGPTGFIFEDSNECGLNISKCEQICVNRRFGYSCGCWEGYELTDDNHTCADVDECAVLNGRCEHFCVNAIGSYHCSCLHGFTVSRDKRTCVDVDECCPDQMPVTPCLDTHTCINTRGSYSCILKGRVRIPDVKSDIKPAGGSKNDKQSIFLSDNLIIGVIIWLGVLTILSIICVILASSLNPKTIYGLVLNDTMPVEQGAKVSDERKQPAASAPTVADDNVFPRINLNNIRPGDTVAEREHMRNMAPAESR